MTRCQLIDGFEQYYAGLTQKIENGGKPSGDNPEKQEKLKAATRITTGCIVTSRQGRTTCCKLRPGMLYAALITPQKKQRTRKNTIGIWLSSLRLSEPQSHWPRVFLPPGLDQSGGEAHAAAISPRGYLPVPPQRFSKFSDYHVIILINLEWMQIQLLADFSAT